jgi:hypothetical protein
MSRPITTAAADDAVLEYFAYGDPYPLDPGKSGTLHVVVFNPGGWVVDCEKLDIVLDVGDRAGDVLRSSVDQPPASATGGWTVKGAYDKDNGVVVFQATPPRTGGLITDDSVTITLPNLAIGTRPGVALLSVIETAARNDDQKTGRFATVPVVKHPPPAGSALDGRNPIQEFLCDNPTVPRGGDAHLRWDSPVPATFTLHRTDETYKGTTALGNVHQHVAVVDRDVTFVLTAQYGGHEYHATTTVAVDRPDLRTRHVSVTGNARLLGSACHLMPPGADHDGNVTVALGAGDYQAYRLDVHDDGFLIARARASELTAPGQPYVWAQLADANGRPNSANQVYQYLETVWADGGVLANEAVLCTPLRGGHRGKPLPAYFVVQAPRSSACAFDFLLWWLPYGSARPPTVHHDRVDSPAVSPLREDA